MKKISLYIASLAALGLGFSACNELHNDLRLETPTSYTLETPKGADQLMIFGASGSNVDNKLEVVTYNPYNITTVVDFQVQVAKSEADFDAWDKLIMDNGDSEDYNYTDAEGLPYVSLVAGTFTSPTFTVPGADFCDAINAVYGFETADEATAASVKVAYRVHAWVPNVNYSSIFSNAVVLDEVMSYLPLREPRKLYLIGQPSGWDINNGDMYAQETEPGSNIYKGSFSIAAGQFQFRFYSQLGNWEENSIGAQAVDEPVDIEFTDDVYTGPVVVYNPAEDILGKGSWQYPDWQGGKVDIEINLNEYTISMIAHEGESDTPSTPAPEGNVLYMVGAPQGWKIDASDVYLSETVDGSNIYEGVFEVKEGEFQFRFYSQLGDWDKYSIGSQNEDEPIDIEFDNGKYSGEVVVYDPEQDILGKGTWKDANWPGGYVKVVIDLSKFTITMSEAEKPAEKVDIYLRGGMNGWGTEAAYQFSATDKDNVWVLDSVTIDADVQFKVADSNWGAINLGGPGEEDGVVVDINSEFTLVDNGKNLVLTENFTGKATLTLDGDTYTLLLTPAN